MKDKIITIIIIIIFALILAISLVMILDKKDPIDKELISIENENTNTTNIIKEDKDNNTIENNIIDDNTVDENTTSNIIGKEEKESEEENKNSSGNNDEKAISLVKKEWGDSESSVYFNIENKNGTKYTITVRSSETTEAIAWYDVDVNTGKIISN